MTKLIDFTAYPVKDVLPILLKDHTTGKNIVFATDSYAQQGEQYAPTSCMSERSLAGIEPRIAKQTHKQAERTRKRAEVFTPAWICCKMNNFCDEQWFNGDCPFNVQYETTWRALSKPVPFSNAKAWQKYVDSRRLEITCGEAPFLASRYDASTGNILPVSRRIGILDRKLRVVSENAQTETDWLEWALRALQSVYGYELQGDSLLIARINLLATFADFLAYRWGRLATDRELKQAARIVSRNLWQMDGINAAVPFAKKTKDTQLTLFDDLELQAEIAESFISPKIKNWRGKKIIEFKQLAKSGGKEMKFDFVIGNPPYQETMESTSDKPIYNFFMDAAYQIADKVILITPARFLFNAGKTPKPWNEKMLSDTHLKIIYYEQDSSKVFSNTDIKGGVVVTYHDNNSEFTPIGLFTVFDELNSIKIKVWNSKVPNLGSIADWVYAPESYKFSDSLFSDYPDIENRLSKGHKYDVVTNIFEKLDDIITEDKPNDKYSYIQLFGLNGRNRCYRWIRKDYIKPHPNLGKYKLFIPKSNGSGALGVIGQPEIGRPQIGHTQSFISIGRFDTKFEANALLLYIKTKFARTLLGILKVTQDNKKETWRLVPLQDFTPSSDINWSKSISEIDAQLYKKYKLTKEEISFIETNVKEMT